MYLPLTIIPYNAGPCISSHTTVPQYTTTTDDTISLPTNALPTTSNTVYTSTTLSPNIHEEDDITTSNTVYTSTTLSPNIREEDEQTSNAAAPSITLLIGSCFGAGVLLLALLLVTLGILLVLRSKNHSASSANETSSLPQSVRDFSGKGPINQINIDLNPAYASSSLEGMVADEIYSYISDGGEQINLSTSSIPIPMSSNEAYSSMTRGETKSPTNLSMGAEQEEIEHDYVVNALVYDTATEIPKTKQSCADRDYVVNQLVYDAVDEKRDCSEPDTDATELTINEAYVVANRATSTLLTSGVNTPDSLNDVVTVHESATDLQ